MKNREFKAFIFDMDGTLVDSGLDFDAMREELGFPKGVPLLEHIEEVKEDHGPEKVREYFSIIHRHEREGALQSTLMEGVAEFLHFLEGQGVATAVLTRNSLEVTHLTFKKWNLKFKEVLSRDCLQKQKPHPEGLLLICERLGIMPENAAYMGDFLFDLQAAKNAKMSAVLYSPERKVEGELKEHADLVVHSFFDLHRNFEEAFLRPLQFQPLML